MSRCVIIVEVEESHHNKETCLNIANEEINMLEYEVKRLKDTNNKLTAEVERCYKLIYGTVSRPHLGK